MNNENFIVINKFLKNLKYSAKLSFRKLIFNHFVNDNENCQHRIIMLFIIREGITLLRKSFTQIGANVFKDNFYCTFSSSSISRIYISLRGLQRLFL